MIGLGTIINTVTVLLGGLIGLLLKKGVSEKMENALMKALGLSTMFIGLSGALAGLLKVTDGALDTQGTFLMILSIVIGTFIGELCQIEERLERLGERLKGLAKSDGGSFVEGFVTVTVIICVGAMAIVGSLEDGLTGDYSTLLAKSILDGVIAIIFASTMGVGVLFSIIPMVVYQGGITLFAKVLEPFFNATGVIPDLSYIGSVLIFSIGINLFFGKKVKSGNMLPALLVPIIYRVFLYFLAK